MRIVWPRLPADGLCPVDDPLHNSLGTDAVSSALARAGVLMPDQAIFLGRSFGFDPAQISHRPAVLIVEGAGVLFRADLSKGAVEMVGCVAELLRRLPQDAPLVPLAAEDVDQLLNWEAEIYRQSLDRKSVDMSAVAWVSISGHPAPVPQPSREDGHLCRHRAFRFETAAQMRDPKAWLDVTGQAIAELGAEVDLSQVRHVAVAGTSGSVLSWTAACSPWARPLMYADPVDDPRFWTGSRRSRHRTARRGARPRPCAGDRAGAPAPEPPMSCIRLILCWRIWRERCWRAMKPMP